ncbi:MAG: DUF3891 family protein, partial [Planctomycetota bacterium]
LYELWQNDDDTITVEPWPFDREGFEVEVEVRLATRLAFDDDRDLIEHLEAAEIETRRWHFAKG